MNTQKVQFIRSAASKKDFIDDGRHSVVFAGRSNVGKSSVINCLLQRKNFARVGATPGKTVQVNYFLYYMCFIFLVWRNYTFKLA